MENTPTTSVPPMETTAYEQSTEFSHTEQDLTFKDIMTS
jgi:hypothetical protein